MKQGHRICLYVNLTTRCDLRCTYCSADVEGAPPVHDLSIERLESALEELDIGANDVIVLTGAEPALHPSFREMTQVCSRRGAFLTLTSNANWFSGFLDLDSTAVLTHMNLVEVSLVSMDPAVDAVLTRVDGNLARRVLGIRNLLAGARVDGYLVRLKVVLLQPNVVNLGATIETALSRLGRFHEVALVYPNLGGSLLRHRSELLPTDDSLRTGIKEGADSLLTAGVPFELIRLPPGLLPSELQQRYDAQLASTSQFWKAEETVYLDPTERIQRVEKGMFPALPCSCQSTHNIGAVEMGPALADALATTGSAGAP
jgi:hypothetical protein